MVYILIVFCFEVIVLKHRQCFIAYQRSYFNDIDKHYFDDVLIILTFVLEITVMNP